jgi:tetratricopeptide (TPR) repeat protein
MYLTSDVDVVRAMKSRLEHGRKAVAQGMHRKALEYFQTALGFAQYAEAGSRFEGYSLHHLGKAYRACGDLELARNNLLQALIHLRRDQRSSSLILGDTVADLAEVCLAMGRFETAERLLQDGLRRFNKDEGEFGRIRARLLKGMARICREKREYEPAKTILSKAIAIYIRIYGQDHALVKEILNDFHHLMEAMYPLPTAWKVY